MESDIALIRERKPELSVHSVNTYRQSLKRLYKVSPSLDVNEIKKYVYNLENVAVARNLITPLLILKKPGFRQIFDDLANRYHDYVINQTPTERQRRNVTTLAKVRKMVRRMREDVTTHDLLSPTKKLNQRERRLVIAYISYSILLELPMRSNLADLRVVQTVNAIKNKNQNFYVVSQRSIFLNDFKTKRAFARRDMLPLKLTLSQKSANLVNLYIAQNKIEGGPLFHQMSKSKHNNILLAHSYKYLGVRIGVTMLRHIILSEFEKKNPSLRERKEMMKKMQQINIETQMSYRFL